jgi:hypothetical protein
MKVYELFVNEENEFSGVFAISVVDRPAIGVDFIKLRAEDIELSEVNKEKRILMGAVLIPEKRILRHKEQFGGDYQIFFSAETVEKAAFQFQKRGFQTNATLQHDALIDNVSVVESWIVEDPEMDKSKIYGLSVPKGTWMVSMKIENDDIWTNYVKTGKVKGFSLEGMFDDKLELSESEILINKIKTIINEYSK